MSSIWGNRVKISLFGESHSPAIGVTIDGLPAGEPINMEEILLQLGRRAPGQDSTATPRKERDMPEILSGLKQGITEGSPLTAMIRNENIRSEDYEDLQNCPRPGHADFTAALRYSGANDPRGGGHFSGRLTAPLVFAGSVARQILARRGIVIAAHALRIAGISDEAFDSVNPDIKLLSRLNTAYFSVISPMAQQRMREKIEAARQAQNSVGGIVECVLVGVPPGLGDPMFHGVENVFSEIIFGIPAVKGLAFGAGFAAADLQGTVNNDEFYFDERGVVRTRTNHAGGILGGITTGMPILFQTAIKPTPSVSLEQKTVNLSSGENTGISIRGRHDPCIVPRAIPVVEAAAALAILDIM
ncbi:MAG: chorismate synthase [Oscillospiraceae bacterium]